MRNFKWYAISCISNKEKEIKAKILSKVKRNNHEAWLNRIEVPLEKTLVMVKGKKSEREKVSMPGYILMEADISNPELLEDIKSVNGVMGFINNSMGGRIRKGLPEAMKLKEVERFLTINEKVNLKPKWKFHIGDRVKMLDGPFTTFEGNIFDLDESKENVKVIVKIFGRETPVDLNFSQIMKI